MRLPLSLQLAFRFSRGKKRGGMVSLISILSTAGIALGVAVLIIGLSAMNGFENELNHRILDVVPQGDIAPVNAPFTDWPAQINTMQAVPGITGAAPYVQLTGLIENGKQLRAIAVRGVDPNSEAKVSALPHYIPKEQWVNFQPGQGQIILGNGLAQTLQVKLGSNITLLIPNHAMTNKILQPKRVRLKVVGILKLSGMLDNRLALIPLNDAQNYLNMGSAVTGIVLRMQDPFKAQALVRAAGEASGEYVYIRSWIGEYGYMYRDIQMIRTIMYLAMVLVIGVASFNIISTLVMAVKDKSTDIAVLRSIGASDGLIRSVFNWYGLLSGLTGCVFGVLLGVVVSLNLTDLVQGLQQLIGHKLLASDIYFIDFLPSELRIRDVVIVLITAILLSLLASWYPARRAMKIQPAKVLNG
jgi:lipoprotein-releasing system permease protein